MHKNSRNNDLNANSSPAGKSLLSIPTTVPAEHDGAWKFGACQADMSRHWGYPLDGNANSLYGQDHGIHVLPIIPMYSVPDGLGAGITHAGGFWEEWNSSQNPR